MAAALSAYKEEKMSKTAKIIIALIILFIAGAVSVLYAMDFSIVPQTKHVVCDILETDENKIVLEVKNETNEDYYYTDYYWFTKYDEKAGEQIRLEYK